MTNKNPPVTLAAIETFERERDLSLPTSYKQFLLATNGGTPEVTAFPVTLPRTLVWEVRAFLGIGVNHPTSELAYAYDLYVGGFPEGIVPIADDDAGNYVCLDLRNGRERGVMAKKHSCASGKTVGESHDLTHTENSARHMSRAVARLISEPRITKDVPPSQSGHPLVSTRSALEVRILEHLETLGACDVASAMNVLMRGTGGQAELATMQWALAKLVRADLVRLAMTRDAAARLRPLSKSDSLDVIEDLRCGLRWRNGRWTDTRHATSSTDGLFPYLTRAHAS